MTCGNNITRIAEICDELLNIIDDGRAQCDSDGCELIHCVVYDCVQHMRRVIDSGSLHAPVCSHLDRAERVLESLRSIN